MTRISSLALTGACSAIMLGCALIAAAPIVLAHEAQPKAAVAAPPVGAPASAQQATVLPKRAAAATTDAAHMPRRAVRVVYVGPVTAR